MIVRWNRILGLFPLLLVWLSLLALTSCADFGYRYEGQEEARLMRAVLGDQTLTAPSAPTLVLNQGIMDALDERISSSWNDRHKLNELRRYLFGEDGRNLQYDSNETRTAVEVWESGRGNCLSMTNLFIAVARYVGLDAEYQTVSVKPTWDHAGETMIRYEHIIVAGRLSHGDEYFVDFLPDFVVGDRPASRISDRRAMALYFNNIGAENVIQGKNEVAIASIRKALQLYPISSDAWNNMGAAMRRNGQMELAEFSYQRALYLDRDNYSALSNLAQFYQTQDREDEAKHFVKSVDRYRRRNPYFHFFLAKYFFEQGENAMAIVLLEESIRLKRDDPDFYDAMAAVYGRLGSQDKEKSYRVLSAKFRKGERGASVLRERNHRFWIQSTGIKP